MQLQHHTTLHNTTLHYTNYIALHLQLQLQLQLPLHCPTLHYTDYNTLQLQLHYFTLRYTRLHYTIPHDRNTTLQHTTIYYNYTTPQLQLQLQLQLHYTNYITLELQLTTTTTSTTSLQHTTSNSCGGVTTATIATTPKITTPTTFRPISGFALSSVIHNNRPLL